ncbi:glutamate-cysteine ligase family protein [Kitasatospora arboriphila]
MTAGARLRRALEVPTVGVEEEFLLVDRHSRLPVGRAPGVVKEASDVLGERVQTEFFTSQAEVCTRPARSLPELRADLVHLRAVLREAAAGADCRPVGTAMPVIADGHPRRSPTRRGTGGSASTSVRWRPARRAWSAAATCTSACRAGRGRWH